ncbi:MAG: carotenoid oxygenase family protein [Holophagales bacterium]|nr:carotenoid oxygenase family protein [Holophagales bacterium]
MSPGAEATAAESHAAGHDPAPLLENVFSVETREGCWPLDTEAGPLPSWLRGTYYLNGPSRFRVGKLAYRHWLDGDGSVARVRFDGSTAELTQRFVGTEKRRREREEGRPLYRTFGTAFEGDQLMRGVALQSPANVSAFRFGDHLLAFGEQGLPYDLDPVTLETRGEHTFGGRLNAISPLSAHPCFDREGGMFEFGVSFSALQPSLTLYRFSPEGHLVYRRRHPLPYPCSTHDFAISGEHVVFFLSPFVLDVGRVMSEGASVMDSLEWRPSEGSRMMVLDKATGDLRGVVPVGCGYCLHLIHAFEDGDRLIVDVVELERPVYDQYQVLPDLFVEAPRAVPRRRVLDSSSLEVLEESEIEYRMCSDFPAVDPRLAEQPYDDFWLLGISKTEQPGRKFFDQLAHLSWQRPETPDLWTAPESVYLGGEPAFLAPGGRQPREGEPRGLVMCQELDAATLSSAFLLFDAFQVSRGPVARLRLPHPAPLGFHAVYYPDP